MDCHRCPDRKRCMTLQLENYRRRALIYPFARPQCEADAEDAPTRSYAGITDQVRRVLASTDRPLSSEEVMRAIGLSGRDALQAIATALKNLKHAGRIYAAGTTLNSHERTVQTWALADRNARQ